MKKLLAVFIFILTSYIAPAQLYEIGAFAGGSNAIADAGTDYFIYPNSWVVGGIAKYNYSSRITFRGTALGAKLIMADRQSDNPYRQERGRSFGNRLIEGVVGIEFNYKKFSYTRVGFSSTPYLFLEAGAAYYQSDYSETTTTGTLTETKDITKNIITPVIPIGIGYKFRLADNLGFGIETSFRYLFRDDIEGFSEDFGNPNSNDWYVFTGVTFTYVFGRPDCNCDERFF